MFFLVVCSWTLLMAGGYGGFKEQTLPALYVSDTRGRFLKLTSHRHGALVPSLFAYIFSSTLTNSFFFFFLFYFFGTCFNTSDTSSLLRSVFFFLFYFGSCPLPTCTFMDCQLKKKLKRGSKKKKKKERVTMFSENMKKKQTERHLNLRKNPRVSSDCDFLKEGRGILKTGGRKKKMFTHVLYEYVAVLFVFSR